MVKKLSICCLLLTCAFYVYGEDYSNFIDKVLAFIKETIRRAEEALYTRAQENSALAADLELIQRGAQAPALERYLPVLYGGSASPLEHISSETLVVLAEPRSLFDDCQRAFDEIRQNPPIL